MSITHFTIISIITTLCCVVEAGKGKQLPKVMWGLDMEGFLMGEEEPMIRPELLDLFGDLKRSLQDLQHVAEEEIGKIKEVFDQIDLSSVKKRALQLLAKNDRGNLVVEAAKAEIPPEIRVEPVESDSDSSSESTSTSVHIPTPPLSPSPVRPIVNPGGVVPNPIPPQVPSNSTPTLLPGTPPVSAPILTPSGTSLVGATSSTPSGTAPASLPVTPTSCPPTTPLHVAAEISTELKAVAENIYTHRSAFEHSPQFSVYSNFPTYINTSPDSAAADVYKVEDVLQVTISSGSGREAITVKLIRAIDSPTSSTTVCAQTLYQRIPIVSPDLIRGFIHYMSSDRSTSIFPGTFQSLWETSIGVRNPSRYAEISLTCTRRGHFDLGRFTSGSGNLVCSQMVSNLITNTQASVSSILPVTQICLLGTTTSPVTIISPPNQFVSVSGSPPSTTRLNAALGNILSATQPAPPDILTKTITHFSTKIRHYIDANIGEESVPLLNPTIAVLTSAVESIIAPTTTSAAERHNKAYLLIEIVGILDLIQRRSTDPVSAPLSVSAINRLARMFFVIGQNSRDDSGHHTCRGLPAILHMIDTNSSLVDPLTNNLATILSHMAHYTNNIGIDSSVCPSTPQDWMSLVPSDISEYLKTVARKAVETRAASTFNNNRPYIVYSNLPVAKKLSQISSAHVYDIIEVSGPDSTPTTGTSHPYFTTTFYRVIDYTQDSEFVPVPCTADLMRDFASSILPTKAGYQSIWENHHQQKTFAANLAAACQTLAIPQLRRYMKVSRRCYGTVGGFSTTTIHCEESIHAETFNSDDAPTVSSLSSPPRTLPTTDICVMMHPSPSPSTTPLRLFETPLEPPGRINEVRFGSNTYEDEQQLREAFRTFLETTDNSAYPILSRAKHVFQEKLRAAKHDSARIREYLKNPSILPTIVKLIKRVTPPPAVGPIASDINAFVADDGMASTILLEVVGFLDLVLDQTMSQSDINKIFHILFFNKQINFYQSRTISHCGGFHDLIRQLEELSGGSPLPPPPIDFVNKPANILVAIKDEYNLDGSRVISPVLSGSSQLRMMGGVDSVPLVNQLQIIADELVVSSRGNMFNGYKIFYSGLPREFRTDSSHTRVHDLLEYETTSTTPTVTTFTVSFWRVVEYHNTVASAVSSGSPAPAVVTRRSLMTQFSLVPERLAAVKRVGTEHSFVTGSDHTIGQLSKHLGIPETALEEGKYLKITLDCQVESRSRLVRGLTHNAVCNTQRPRIDIPSTDPIPIPGGDVPWQTNICISRPQPVDSSSAPPAAARSVQTIRNGQVGEFQQISPQDLQIAITALSRAGLDETTTRTWTRFQFLLSRAHDHASRLIQRTVEFPQILSTIVTVLHKIVEDPADTFGKQYLLFEVVGILDMLQQSSDSVEKLREIAQLVHLLFVNDQVIDQRDLTDCLGIHLFAHATTQPYHVDEHTPKRILETMGRLLAQNGHHRSADNNLSEKDIVDLLGIDSDTIAISLFRIARLAVSRMVSTGSSSSIFYSGFPSQHEETRDLVRIRSHDVTTVETLARITSGTSSTTNVEVTYYRIFEQFITPDDLSSHPLYSTKTLLLSTPFVYERIYTPTHFPYKELTSSDGTATATTMDTRLENLGISSSAIAHAFKVKLTIPCTVTPGTLRTYPNVQCGGTQTSVDWRQPNDTPSSQPDELAITNIGLKQARASEPIMMIWPGSIAVPTLDQSHVLSRLIQSIFSTFRRDRTSPPSNIQRLVELYSRNLQNVMNRASIIATSAHLVGSILLSTLIDALNQSTQPANRLPNHDTKEILFLECVGMLDILRGDWPSPDTDEASDMRKVFRLFFVNKQVMPVPCHGCTGFPKLLDILMTRNRQLPMSTNLLELPAKMMKIMARHMRGNGQVVDELSLIRELDTILVAQATPMRTLSLTLLQRDYQIDPSWRECKRSEPWPNVPRGISRILTGQIANAVSGRLSSRPTRPLFVYSNLPVDIEERNGHRVRYYDILKVDNIPSNPQSSSSSGRGGGGAFQLTFTRVYQLIEDGSRAASFIDQCTDVLVHKFEPKESDLKLLLKIIKDGQSLVRSDDVVFSQIPNPEAQTKSASITVSCVPTTPVGMVAQLGHIVTRSSVNCDNLESKLAWFPYTPALTPETDICVLRAPLEDSQAPQIVWERGLEKPNQTPRPMIPTFSDSVDVVEFKHFLSSAIQVTNDRLVDAVRPIFVRAHDQAKNLENLMVNPHVFPTLISVLKQQAGDPHSHILLLETAGVIKLMLDSLTAPSSSEKTKNMLLVHRLVNQLFLNKQVMLHTSHGVACAGIPAFLDIVQKTSGPIDTDQFEILLADVFTKVAIGSSAELISQAYGPMFTEGVVPQLSTPPPSLDESSPNLSSLLSRSLFVESHDGEPIVEESIPTRTLTLSLLQSDVLKDPVSISPSPSHSLSMEPNSDTGDSVVGNTAIISRSDLDRETIIAVTSRKTTEGGTGTSENPSLVHIGHSVSSIPTLSHNPHAGTTLVGVVSNDLQREQ